MTDLIADRWILDRPNSYIGRSVPRPNAPRLAEGRGTFVDDIELSARAGHAAFVRSPHAHARMRSIDTAAAKAAPGVIAVVTGRELAEIHDPWVGVLTHLEGLKSAPQYALPLQTATWQGEAVVAVVAESRAKAEDAAELVAIDWEVLPAVTDAATARDSATSRRRTPRPTMSSRRPTSSAGTPGCASSRGRSSRTGTRPRSSSRCGTTPSART